MDTFELEIFKAGRQTASNGVEVEFGVSDLSEIASTYNPNLFKAPLIVTKKPHNTEGISDHALADSELAFGFPKSLKVAGDRLKAVFDKDKIVPQVVDWFRQGRLLGVSSSFYQPNSPHNPTPGKYHLRHIAALGKTPPAVKGLAVNFSEETEEEWLCFEQAATEETIDFCDCIGEGGSVADALQSLREWLIADKGLDKADAILPRSLINAIEDRSEQKMERTEELKDRLLEMEQAIAALQYRPIEESQPVRLDYKEEPPKKMLDLQKMMDDAGMEAADVAEATGIDEDELMAYVSGDKKPSAAKLKKIKAALGGDEGMDYSEEISNLRRQLQMYEIEAQSAKREAEAARREAEQARIDQQKAAERERLNAIASFCEGLESQGILLPRQTGTRVLNFGEDESSEMGLIEFMQSLDEEQLSFAQEFLSDLAPQVDYSERAGNGGRVEDQPRKSKIKLPAGHAVNSKHEDLYSQALSYCESHDLDPENTKDWSKAVQAVIG